MKRKILYMLYFSTIIFFTFYFTFKLILNDNKITSNTIHAPLEKRKLPKNRIGFYRESNHSAIGQELIPNYKQTFDGHFVRLPSTIIKINSDGFRDREFSIKKPNNTYRIIALGDSFTFGWGLNLSKTWPKQLEKKLNKLNSTKNFEVLNFGVGGYNTLEEYVMFREKGLKYDPDLLLLDFTLDDCENKTRIRELNEKCEEERTLEEDISCSAEAYRIYRNEMLSNSFKENWNLVEKPLTNLINITKKHNIKMMIFIFPNWPGETREKNSEYTKIILKVVESVKELANEHKIPLINLDKEVYANYPDNKMILDPVDPHPSTFACDVISDEILRNLLNDDLIS